MLYNDFCYFHIKVFVAVQYGYQCLIVTIKFSSLFSCILQILHCEKSCWCGKDTHGQVSKIAENLSFAQFNAFEKVNIQ